MGLKSLVLMGHVKSRFVVRAVLTGPHSKGPSRFHRDGPFLWSVAQMAERRTVNANAPMKITTPEGRVAAGSLFAFRAGWDEATK